MLAHGEEGLHVLYTLTLTLDALGVSLVYMAVRLRWRSWSFVALTALLLAVAGAYAFATSGGMGPPSQTLANVAASVLAATALVVYALRRLPAGSEQTYPEDQDAASLHE
jgi:cell shape-determining protein MreD